MDTLLHIIEYALLYNLHKREHSMDMNLHTFLMSCPHIRVWEILSILTRIVYELDQHNSREHLGRKIY